MPCILGNAGGASILMGSAELSLGGSVPRNRIR